MRGKVVADGEPQLVATDRQRTAMNQRRVGSPVGVGHGLGDQAAFAQPRKLDQFDRNAHRRPAAVRVQHMGRQPSMHRQRIRAAAPAAPDAATQSGRSRASAACSSAAGVFCRRWPNDIEDRVLRMPAHAEDKGKAELRLVGIVGTFERSELRVRQPIQPRAVLLGHGIVGQPRRTLGLVGKVGMRADQCEAALLRGAGDDAEQRLAQGCEACETDAPRRRPRQSRANARRRSQARR